MNNNNYLSIQAIELKNLDINGFNCEAIREYSLLNPIVINCYSKSDLIETIETLKSFDCQVKVVLHHSNNKTVYSFPNTVKMTDKHMKRIRANIRKLPMKTFK